MKESAKLRAVNTVSMWKLNFFDNIFCVNRVRVKQDLFLVSSRATSQLTLWTKPAPPQGMLGSLAAGESACQRPESGSENLCKFESRNKRNSKAESSHSCRLNLLLKRYYQNIPQPWTWKWGCTVKCCLNAGLLYINGVKMGTDLDLDKFYRSAP